MRKHYWKIAIGSLVPLALAGLSIVGWREIQARREAEGLRIMAMG